MDWTPIVGDYFAIQIAKASFCRLIRLRIILLLLIPINILRFFDSWQATTVNAILILLFIFSAFGLPAISNSRLREVAKKMIEQLPIGVGSNSELPKLRQTPDFLAWCSMHNVPLDDVRASSSASELRNES
jgi:hypothetical protein